MGLPTTDTNGAGSPRPLPARRQRLPRPDRPRGHQTSRNERIAVVAVALAGGVAGAFAHAAPTRYVVSDVVIRAGVATLVALATSRARRWSWLVLAGLAAVGTPSGVWLWVCAAALAVAFVTALFPRRRVYGAVIGALSVQGLLRLSDVGFARSSAVLFVVAVAPVVVSAYLVAPRRVRKKIHIGVAIGAGAFALCSVVFVAAVALAYSSVQKGVREAKGGLAAARDGRSEQAATLLDEAAVSFADAHTTLSSWWAKPAGMAPIVAQQVHAVEVVTDEGAKMAASSANSARRADIHELKYTDGRIDVRRLRDLEEPLAETAATFEAASARIAAVRSPWLVGPLGERVDEVERELRHALPEVQLAAEAAREGPALLGADGPRRYFVLFTQPAEARGLGGFVGSWAEITAVDGRLTLERSGRTEELNTAAGRDERRVTAPPVPRDYVERYQRFQPGYYFQDVTLSPDLPSVAAAVSDLLPQMGGRPVDGVIAVDPYAIAALLEFTGPIHLDGYDQPLTAQNAAEFLVREQYTRFGSEDQRADYLHEASRKTFEALLDGSLPSPPEIAEVLGPVVAQRRLSFHVFDESARHLVDRLRAGGAFPPPSGRDFFQLVTQNNANNKIDVFLHREVDYAVDYTPATGGVEATARITLRNDAPAAGLPASVIGNNDQGLPFGTNRVYLSFYSPLGLREAKVGGQQAPVEFQHELGYSVYSRYFDLAPGATVELELSLFGQIDPGSTYRLGIGTQPLVNRDEVDVRLQPTGDWEIARSDTLSVDPNGAIATLSLQPAQDVDLAAELARP